ncbi:MAG: hypothetical protein ACI84C_000285 [Flavobacteriales bacterium]|jgi:hypothetical protein
MVRITYLFLLLTFVLGSCKKDPVVFENNDIPPYDEIATIIVNNYVNRLFIDIIGREPLDVEMALEVDLLEQNDLNQESREVLVQKLMYSESPVDGDISYNHACFHKIYEDTKARFIEGASDGFIDEKRFIFRASAIADSIVGNTVGYAKNMAEANKLQAIKDSNEALRNEEIVMTEVYRRMTYNWIYDEINMNTFNFVNSSFNDLYYRYPTKSEFENAYTIIEFNEPSQLFGIIAQTKLEYLELLISTNECYEGMIQWSFKSLLAREPSANEVFNLLESLILTENVLSVQESIYLSDEYAGFD